MLLIIFFNNLRCASCEEGSSLLINVLLQDEKKVTYFVFDYIM